ncbi:hypothetical protein TNCV_3785521 [Trichonephila clavipes]|nr:hypothetical protein TNCV_3785521 [Trichonephila clavipes]
MANPGHCGSYPEAPGESRGCCLTIRHDFLGVYLHCLGLAEDEISSLCGYARTDGDQVLQSTGLDEYPTVDVILRKGRRQLRCHPRYLTKVENMRSILNNNHVALYCDINVSLGRLVTSGYALPHHSSGLQLPGCARLAQSFIPSVGC